MQFRANGRKERGGTMEIPCPSPWNGIPLICVIKVHFAKKNGMDNPWTEIKMNMRDADRVNRREGSR